MTKVSLEVAVTPLPGSLVAWRAKRSTLGDRDASPPCRAVPLPPLDRLYQSHGPAVLRRARHLLGNEADALEVLHDVFASLLEKPEQYAGQSSLMTFLYSVTTHQALGRLRKDRRRSRLLASNHDPAALSVAPPGQARAELREMLIDLPEELRAVAVYYYLDEMTQEEIAEVLGCSRQWVTKLVRRLKDRAEQSR
jgi:RNA polymerase sigma factor (sigma-70 family)